MIVSVSRRTDIPAFYAEWFFGRLREDRAVSVNPFNPRQRREVSLSAADVDAFVFWTRDPGPLLERFEALAAYETLFHITHTPYGEDLEPAFNKPRIRIDMARLSKKVGPGRLIWRYDPVIFGGPYDLAYHLEAFARLAQTFEGLTDTVVVSFVNHYRKNHRSLAARGLHGGSPAVRHSLLQAIERLAAARGMTLKTCAEPDSPSAGACIDGERLNTLKGNGETYRKDPNQRPACFCAQSVDIGRYGTCLHGCVYCYATGDARTARRNYHRHDVDKAGLLP